MRSTLANVAAMLGTTIDACPWHALRFAHVAALRAVLAERFAPATTNKYMSAIRQVMRQAWLLGLMDGEDYQRAAAVRNVKGSRLPAGRALEGGEIRALFAACADGTPAGARDAAAFAMMFGMGMRRAEVAAARLADYEADSGTKPPASCTCPTSGTRLEAACTPRTGLEPHHRTPFDAHGPPVPRQRRVHRHRQASPDGRADTSPVTPSGPVDGYAREAAWFE